MPWRHLSKLVFLFFLAALPTLSGCGITQPVVGKFKPEYDNLKKKVLVMPLVNQDSSQTEMTAQASRTFLSLLAEGPNLIIYEPGEKIAPSDKISSADFGITTPPELIKQAQDMGMNALITGFINPIRTDTGRAGIWPFRKSYKFYEISISTNVIDVTTECMCLTNLESESVRISIERLENIDEQEFKEGAVQEVMPEILERQVEKIVESLMRNPWSGRILGVNKKGIKISAGKAVGAKSGQVFAVFNKGETIVSKKGRRLSLLGEKTGEIRIKHVRENFSIAEGLGERTFRTGQIIRPVTE